MVASDEIVTGVILCINPSLPVYHKRNEKVNNDRKGIAFCQIYDSIKTVK